MALASRHMGNEHSAKGVRHLPNGGGAQPLLGAVLTGKFGVSARLHPTRVEIASDKAILAGHARVLNAGHICCDWQHYIALVQRKPGALRQGAPFAATPAPLQRLRQGLRRHDGDDKTMAQVLNCVPSHGLEAVLVAVELVIESGSISTEHVLNVLTRLNASPARESVQNNLRLLEAPVANTGRHD